ncbi:MAG: allantoin racemase, partial [Yoonia sp.]
MSGDTLIIINPNSSQVVTDGIDVAVDPLRRFGTPMRCLTLP